MNEPVRWLFAAVEVLVAAPLFIGRNRVTATMPPGRDRRVVLACLVLIVVLSEAWILLMPSDLA